jgi:predicted kinase
MVIILRGPSGAGKSTYARKNHPTATVVSADDFFMVRGNYEFDPKRLGEAHGSCLIRFVEAVTDESKAQIVVDNTNTTVAEVAPYAALALAYGHTLKIVTFVGDWRIAARRNVHGVSEATVESQANRTGEAMFPPWWPHETVEIR